MVTMAKRLEELRTERNLSRPALAAALGFPRTAIEKFETGRQTPSQDQQEKMAAYFGVSLFYLRGERGSYLHGGLDGRRLPGDGSGTCAGAPPGKGGQGGIRGGERYHV